MTKKHTVKGWAIILKETKQIQTAAYFGNEGCSCCNVPDSISIYEKKADAIRDKAQCLNPGAQKVVPCEITYTTKK